MKKTITAIIIIALAACCIAASASAVGPSGIQAVLSPDITLKYNGEVQVMRDVNGNIVYPIMYNGTTYLPVRAVSNMLDLPVAWIGETKTIELGMTSVPPKSFLDATDAGTKTTTGNICKWIKVLHKGELPATLDDFGNTLATHSEAIKTDACYMGQQTRTKYKMDGMYRDLSFTAYNRSNYPARIQVFDCATGSLLWSVTLSAGASIYVSAIDISKSVEIEFTANLNDVPGRAAYYEDAVYICDPLVK
jgi:hypothetical protein